MRYGGVCMKCSYWGGEIATHGTQGTNVVFETSLRRPICGNQQRVNFRGT
jgi:hypothetical protein